MKLARAERNRITEDVGSAVVVRSVEINDSKNRFVLTRGQTQADIGKEFGVAVCTKGRFYDNGAYPAPGQEPRLTLEISGKDAAKVAACERKVIELVTALNPLALLGIASVPQGDYQRAQMTSLVHGASAPGAALAPSPAPAPAGYAQQSMPLSMPIVPGGGAHGYMQSGVVGGFKEEKVFITGLDNPPPNFSVMGKLLGPGGSYIKHICAETGCKTYLRGLGSKQQPGDTGFGEPLHIHIQGGREENVARAVGLAQNLIQTVRDAYEEANKLRQQQLQQLQMVQAAARPMNPMMIVNPMAGMYGQMPMQQQYPYQQSYMQPQYQQQQQQQQQQASAPAAATGDYDPNVYAQWYNDYVAYYGQPPGPEYPPPGSAAAAAAPSAADAASSSAADDVNATKSTGAVSPLSPADASTAAAAETQRKPVQLD